MYTHTHIQAERMYSMCNVNLMPPQNVILL